MTIEKALIIQQKGPQLLRSDVHIDWARKRAECQFCVVGVGIQSGASILQLRVLRDRKEYEPCVRYAKCIILFTPPPGSSWSDAQILNSTHVGQRLSERLVSGQGLRYNNLMIYRMVDTLVKYSEEYRSLQEIILDSNAMEALGTALFVTPAVMNEMSFHTHPLYVDSFCQVAGFVMNANNASDLGVKVYVNHGWDSFRLFEAIQPGIKYSIYVKMTEKEGSLWGGDIVVIGDGRLVAVFANIRVRTILRAFLPNMNTQRMITKSF